MSRQKAAGSRGDSAPTAIKRYVGGGACYHQSPRMSLLGSWVNRGNGSPLVAQALESANNVRAHEYVGRRAEMSIFPTKILLATDGSEEAQLALSTAVDQANSTNSELHVVTVGPWNPDPAYATHEVSFRWQSYEEVTEAIGKEAQQILDEQVKKIE